MKRRLRRSSWAKVFERSFVALTRVAAKSGRQVVRQTLKAPPAARQAPKGEGAWIPGIAMGAGGGAVFVNSFWSSSSFLTEACAAMTAASKPEVSTVAVSAAGSSDTNATASAIT